MKLFILALIPLFNWAADPPKQPIAFSHKQHAGSLNLKCQTCHTSPAPSEVMTFPAEEKCMSCHKIIKPDSEEIQKLAKFFTDKKRIPWVRVYQIPTFVFWSHKSHLDAEVACSDCHGDVKSLSIMAKEKDLNMGSCMDCHRQKKVSNDCTFCHDKMN